MLATMSKEQSQRGRKLWFSMRLLEQSRSALHIFLEQISSKTDFGHALWVHDEPKTHRLHFPDLELVK